jgi:hypothetical protein
MDYLYYYNAVRKHSSLQRLSPWQHLASNSPDLDAKIRFVPPILLDNIAVQLGDWSGYHLLAQVDFIDSYPSAIMSLVNIYSSKIKKVISPGRYAFTL